MITQHDHALLSGRLAAYWSDSRVTLPEPIEQAIAGIAQHDSGWPLLDDSPRIHPDGSPADFLNHTINEYITVWRASAEAASAYGPLAGYLVSAHSEALAAFSMQNESDAARAAVWRAYVHEQQDRRSNMAESAGWSDRELAAADMGLLILQQMDRLSLLICCDPHVIQDSSRAPWSQANRKLPLRVHGKDDSTLVIEPWPFSQCPLIQHITVRKLSQTHFDNDDSLRRSMAGAQLETLTCQLVSGA